MLRLKGGRAGSCDLCCLQGDKTHLWVPQAYQTHLTCCVIEQRASGTNPRSVDLSGVQLTPTSASILSDVFTIEWGLRKLTLRECDLDEYVSLLSTWLPSGLLSNL